MQRARNSTLVDQSPEETRRLWDQWVKEHGQPDAEAEQVFAQTGEDMEAQAGNVAFEPANGKGTEVIMELDYNPEVVKGQGLADDWVQRRISQYLDRFREYAESS